jgi:hypothetical protein
VVGVTPSLIPVIAYVPDDGLDLTGSDAIMDGKKLQLGRDEERLTELRRTMSMI